MCVVGCCVGGDHVLSDFALSTIPLTPPKKQQYRHGLLTPDITKNRIMFSDFLLVSEHKRGPHSIVTNIYIFVYIGRESKPNQNCRFFTSVAPTIGAHFR